LSAKTTYQKAKDLLHKAKEILSINPKRAHQYATQAFSLVKSKNDEIRAICIFYMGSSQLLLSKYRMALDLLIEANNAFVNIENQIYEAKTLNGIGNVYLRLDDYNKGLKYYLHAYHVFKVLNYEHGIAMTLTSIGSAYCYLKKYKLGLRYFLEALSVANKNDDTLISILIITNNNIGSAYLRLGNLENAEYFCNKALVLSLRSKDKLSTRLVLRNIAETKLKMSLYEEALVFIKQSLKYAFRVDHKESIVDSLLVWAKIKIKQKCYTEVIEKLRINEQIFREEGSVIFLYKMNELLSFCYEKNGNLKKAFDTFKLAYKNRVKLHDVDDLAKTRKLTTLHDIDINLREKQRESQVQFSRRLIEFQEKERKRISSDLHDSLGQSLLIINNKLLLTAKSNKGKSLQHELSEISNLTIKAIDEVRQISQNICPYELDRLG